jgi:hypothetical protein
LVSQTPFFFFVLLFVVRLLKPVLDHTEASSKKIHAVHQTQLIEQIASESNPKLIAHLQELNIDLLYFAFRWNVCFLIREFSLENVYLIWDYYLLDSRYSFGFAEFHPFVCVALLAHFEAQLLQCSDTTEALLFLQNLPTAQWTSKDVKLLIEQARRIQHQFQHFLKEKDLMSSFLLL